MDSKEIRKIVGEQLSDLLDDHEKADEANKDEIAKRTIILSADLGIAFAMTIACIQRMTGEKDNFVDHTLNFSKQIISHYYATQCFRDKKDAAP